MDNNILFSPETITVNALMHPDTDLLASDEKIYIFLGQDFSIKLVDFVPDELKDEFLDFVKNCTSSHSSLVTRLRRYDGVYVDVSVMIKKIRLKNSEYIDVHLYDIKAMSDYYWDFAYNNNMHKNFDKLIQGIRFIYFVESEVIEVVKGGDIIFSGNINKWRDKSIEDGLIEKDSEEMFRQICSAIANASGSGYFVTDTAFFTFDKDREYRPTSINFNIVTYGQRPAYAVGIISNTNFPDRSRYDSLTCLYNKREIRRLTDIILKETLVKDTETVLVIIDLDHFKEMNDTFGHLAGDRALINTARIIKDVIGKQGLVGRIGGDEFFAVLPDYPKDHDALRRLMRCIRTQIRWHFLHCDEDVNVTCSIGAAIFNKDADNYDDVFKLADHCLYLAKTKGRNRFVIFNPLKHGSAADILKNAAVVQAEETFTDDDKTKHILSVIKRCNAANEVNRKELVREILCEIHKYYGIDRVQLCSADKKEYFEASNSSAEEPFAFLELYDTYREKIDQRGFLALGNYMNSRGSLPEIADHMSQNEFCSLFIARYTDENDRLCSIFVMTNKTQHSWSEFEINSLLIIFGLIGRFA